MLDFIKNIFEKKGGKDQSSAGTYSDIQIATCAILLEIASIDGEFSPQERTTIISLLINNFELSSECANELIKSSEQEMSESIDLWQYTNLINKNFSHPEKIKIIEMVWKVIYADQKLTGHEDYLIHRLAALLNLSHKELISAKMKNTGQ